MATFTELPQDVIDCIIFFLPQEDIHSLSQTCELLHWQIKNSSYIWQMLYHKTFGTKPTPFTFSNWPELFHLRRGGKLYTWGSLVGGRLGYTSKDIPREHLVRNGFNMGVAKPTRVPGLENFVIADVSAGGFSFQFLTSNGEIYHLGNWHSGNRGPGPDETDFNPFRNAHTQNTHLHRSGVPNPPDLGRRLLFRGRGRLGGVRIGAPGLVDPQHRPQVLIPPRTAPVVDPIEDKDSNRFLNKALTLTQENVRFVSVSSGRCHFIALDDTGRIWSWDDPRANAGVPLKFTHKGEDLIVKGHKVLRCSAGWGSSVAYLYGHGLVYWNRRAVLNEGDDSAIVFHQTILDTASINGADRVVDFVVGDSFVVYLTAGGKLYRNDMVGLESIELVKFQDALDDGAMSLKPKFTRLSGNFTAFACFSNEDIVIMGTKNSDAPQLVDGLKGKECISVAVGDYHFLALLKDGTLLSWGLESSACGCLGLGSEPEGARRENNGATRVLQPTRVETDGKVLAITAAGWHSGAIISE